MNYNVLAADDEMELLDALELYLIRENITLLKAADGLEAMKIFAKQKVHLALLDVMMPKLDGFGVLRKIRQTSKIPAIMCTARGEDYDKILGLELGADDYITKPYNPMEVVARIKAQLRRNYDYLSESKDENKDICIGPFCLSIQEGSLKRDGIEIPVTKTEFMILKLLMSNPGRIFTKQQIFNSVWEEEYLGDDSTVMVHMSNLRAKLELNQKSPEWIKTIKGLGYKFEKEVK